MGASLSRNISTVAEGITELLDGGKPVCGMILGSGLNFFADLLEDPRMLPYGELEPMGVSTVEGHKGRFVCGSVPGTGKTVLCMQGRLHGYEGWSSQTVALPVWAMEACGINMLITTNAAGAINPGYSVGSFCLMSDMINLTGRNPLCGSEPAQLAPRFVPMAEAFDAELRKIAKDAAAQEGISLHEGVYLGLLGPSFETPAEIRAFATMGADTVAMSVVEEVIAARHVGMRVMGISLISNMACGVLGGDPTVEEVDEQGEASQGDFRRFMEAIVGSL